MKSVEASASFREGASVEGAMLAEKMFAPVAPHYRDLTCQRQSPLRFRLLQPVGDGASYSQCAVC
ncbi:MAG: hypothetical protein M3430_11545 [Acidobacteriota bacterium]|nr:hypothetical protein [Acidobacteriota bacterium]